MSSASCMSSALIPITFLIFN